MPEDEEDAAEFRGEFLRRLIFLAAEMGEFFDPEDTVRWFFERQRLANDRRPIDMVADEGDFVVLCQRLAALHDGAFL